MGNWRDTIRALGAIPDIGSLALDPQPAWIFDKNGSALLWCNLAGGLRLGAKHFRDLAQRNWPKSLARELTGAAQSLPPGGALVRVHLPEGAAAPASLCRCRLVRTEEAGRAILLIGTDQMRLPSDPAQALENFLSDDDPGLQREPENVSPEARESGETGTSAAPAQQSSRALHEAGEEIPATHSPADEPSPDSAAEEQSRRSEDEDYASLDAWVRRQFSSPGSGASEPAAPVSSASPSSEAAAQSSPSPAQSGSELPASPEPSAAAAAPSQLDSPPVVDPVPRRGPAISAGRVDRELTRKPVRFLWQTDAANRILFISPGLSQVVARNAEIVGEVWEDAAERLRLDPLGRIAAAFQKRDTWSGEIAWWPVEGSNVRVPAELTALPVFGPDRSFQGYRGFGVLRPAEALMPAAFDARFGLPPRPSADQLPPYEEAVSTAPANVVPIRGEIEKLNDTGRLSPVERNAFEEIAAALRDRILNGRSNPPAGQAQNSESPTPKADDVDADPRSPQSEVPTPTPAASVRPLFPERRKPSIVARMPGPTRAPQTPLGKLPLASKAPDAPLPAKPAAAETPPAEPPKAAGPAESRPIAESQAASSLRELSAQRRLLELTAILDTATDGVLVLDGDGLIESVNASAEALFGLEASELHGTNFLDLLLPESRSVALDYLNGLRDNGVASLLNEGREVEARSGTGSLPLFMTMGRIGSEAGDRFCAVLRDITHWKRAEAELVGARRAAEQASSQKSEFLARVSHEIRTPLNAIIGFAEVMIEEQFGPIANERYREYLRDIRTSGEHVVSLVNDLLDISKIEAGKLDLTFTAVALNELVRECIALMQPQASRARVVIRSSLAREVPGVVADERTLRQVVLNLLSNSVKYTGPGGQVIASTTLAESGEAVLRIRDTGQGMSEEELARAMEPFRQLSTSAIGDRNGTGLGLPLTKALVEANRAGFSIRSGRGEGTVVKVTFPPTRVLSE